MTLCLFGLMISLLALHGPNPGANELAILYGTSVIVYLSRDGHGSNM